jgi:hypothetical protein
MSEVELALAFLLGVVMGMVLDHWLTILLGLEASAVWRGVR